MPQTPPAGPGFFDTVTEEQWARGWAENTLPFLAALAGTAPAHAHEVPFTWQIIDDSRRGRVVPEQFTSPFATAAERFVQLQRAGGGVFVTVNETNGTGRTADAIQRIRAQWLDLDSTDLPTEELAASPPTMRVRTGKGWHLYFLLHPGESISHERSVGLNRAIASRLGGDRTATDVARVLRVPGFWHLKNPADPRFVALVELRPDRRYTVAELERIFPPEEVAAAQRGPRTRVALTDAEREWGKAAARAYLIQTPVAVEGNGGDTRTFEVCAKVGDWITDDTMALQLLSEWNARCRPPWSPNELRQKWEHAKRYRRESLGSAVVSERMRADLARNVVPIRPDVRHPVEAAAHATPPIDAPHAPVEDIPWQARLLLTADGKIQQCPANVMCVLQHHPDWRGVLGFDEMRERIVKLQPPPWTGGKAGEWQDEDTTKTQVWLNHTDIRQSTPTVHAVVSVVARDRPFHPVREFLGGLEWDGVPRVDSWLERYCGARITDESDPNLRSYVSRVGRYFLIAACARVMQPGCKVDTVMILEGAQGKLKSAALRAIAVRDEWYSDTGIDIGSKDALQAMQGKWIIELAELDSLNRAEASRAKAFISSPIDTYRKPYGIESVTVYRQSIIVGTVNPVGPSGGYFKDETGNRRYHPVYCLEIDLSGLLAARGQLWAEAFHLYQQGERWWPREADEREWFSVQQEARLSDDPWQEPIVRWLDQQAPDKFVRVAEVLEFALQIEKARWERRMEMRVAACLCKAGLQRVRRRHGSSEKVWGYVRDPTA